MAQQIDELNGRNFQALTALEIISKNDPRLYNEYYDKAHDLFVTPLNPLGPCGTPQSLEEQQKDVQVAAQEIVNFWNRAKLSYAELEKKYEFLRDELRIHRIEKFSDGGISDEVMYVVRVGEDAFFWWTRVIF